MVEFPSLIEFIDTMGLDAIHKEHNLYMSEIEATVSFDEFVKMYYESSKQVWHDDMNSYKKSLDVRFNEENDVALEFAKEIMADIIDEALHDKMVQKIISQNDLATDYISAYHIVNAFRKKVIPAIEAALNELGM